MERNLPLERTVRQAELTVADLAAELELRVQAGQASYIDLLGERSPLLLMFRRAVQAMLESRDREESSWTQLQDSFDRISYL